MVERVLQTRVIKHLNIKSAAVLFSFSGPTTGGVSHRELQFSLSSVKKKIENSELHLLFYDLASRRVADVVDTAVKSDQSSFENKIEALETQSSVENNSGRGRK